MTKLHPKIVGLLIVAVFAAFFAFLVFSPGGEVKATAPGQLAETCKTCHQDHYDLWKISQHGSVPIDCESCHRIDGQGAHPEVPYTIETQALTCDTCHAEKSKEWVSSRHGEIDLGCATCHEPHSQQQKVLKDGQLICANCHQAEFDKAHQSTHLASGVNCENCHLGEDSGHTFMATVASCNSCHSDIHEAGHLVTAGVVAMPANPQDTDGEGETTEAPAAEASAPAEAAVHAGESAVAEEGGIHLPSWLLAAAGLLVGAIASWAIFGKEPGSGDAE